MIISTVKRRGRNDSAVKGEIKWKMNAKISRVGRAADRVVEYSRRFTGGEKKKRVGAVTRGAERKRGGECGRKGRAGRPILRGPLDNGGPGWAEERMLMEGKRENSHKSTGHRRVRNDRMEKEGPIMEDPREGDGEPVSPVVLDWAAEGDSPWSSHGEEDERDYLRGLEMEEELRVEQEERMEARLSDTIDCMTGVIGKGWRQIKEVERRCVRKGFTKDEVDTCIDVGLQDGVLVMHEDGERLKIREKCYEGEKEKKITSDRGEPTMNEWSTLDESGAGKKFMLPPLPRPTAQDHPHEQGGRQREKSGTLPINDLSQRTGGGKTQPRPPIHTTEAETTPVKMKNGTTYTGITPLLPSLRMSTTTSASSASEMSEGQPGGNAGPDARVQAAKEKDGSVRPEHNEKEDRHEKTLPTPDHWYDREEASRECLREGEEEDELIQEESDIEVEEIPGDEQEEPQEGGERGKVMKKPGQKPRNGHKVGPKSFRRSSTPMTGGSGEEGIDEEQKEQRRAVMAQRQRRDRERKVKEARAQTGADGEGGAENGSRSTKGEKPKGVATLGLSQGFLVPLMPPQQEPETTQAMSLRSRSLSAVEREIKAVAEVVNHRCAGGGGEFFAENEPGVQMYDLDAYSTDGEEEMDETTDLDKTVLLEVGQLVAAEMRPEQAAQVRAKKVVPFVVLKFDPNVDKHWTVPLPDVFHDLVNRVEGEIVEENLKCESAYVWANVWGKVGLLGLSPKNPDLINEYRGVLERQIKGNTRFTIFPKDALDKKGNISVLLRASFRSFKAEWLPKAIMRRTRQLKGSLRLTHVKTYADSDVSRAGASKKGWRLALLQGCTRFLISLERFGQDHLFPVGSGQILIRGGSNRPKGKGKDQERPGRLIPQQQQQQRHKAREETKKTSDQYDRSYPAGGLRDVGRGRGAGWKTGTGPGPIGRGAPH